MTTTLLAAEQALSKEIGDYWSSTTDGAGTSTTLVDSALMAKSNDWITDEAYAFLIEEPGSAAAIYDERKISSLDNSDGTLTTLAFGAAPGTGIDYEVHRLFSPSEKRRALVAAAKNIFPACFEEIWDESLVLGNWLTDGSFERWTTDTDLTDWTEDGTVVLAKTSTSPYYKHGTYSCKLGTAAGYIHQDVTDFDDLKHLAGKSVTFTVQGYCATASTLRISIYDGTTETFSSHRTAEGAWTKNNDPMKATATIQDNPTAIEFRIYIDTANDAYVDDARAISGYRSRIYIGHLGFAQNRPHQVFMEAASYSQEEDWIKLLAWRVDPDGYLYIPADYPTNYKLRIRGIGYLDFLASGVASTAWTATIDLDATQLEILVAEAALYLYTWMSLPNFESGTREEFQRAMSFWAGETERRKAKFGMRSPPATIHWGIH